MIGLEAAIRAALAHRLQLARVPAHTAWDNETVSAIMAAHQEAVTTAAPPPAAADKAAERPASSRARANRPAASRV